jgi:hypothetical protein
MAERLKDSLLEKGKVVDIVAGPDSYRSLPYLLSHASSHQVIFILNLIFCYFNVIGLHVNCVSFQAAIDVILSVDETYADIVPVRLNPKSPSAYV